MCGRFTLYTPLNEVVQFFGLPKTQLVYMPSYNIAPTQDVVSVVSWESSVQLMPWGFSGIKGNRIINARLESLGTKPTFNQLVDKHRCIVLADGFFEWKTVSGKKQPYYITMANREPFAFGALYNTEESPKVTLVTTQALGSLTELHHRMPLILKVEQARQWIEYPDFIHIQKTIPQLMQNLVFEPVNPIVNSARNDAPACIEPYKPFIQDKLF